MRTKQRTLAESDQDFDALRESFIANKISFGISFLDDALDGILPQDFIVLAGYTGGGKTEMAVNIALNAARALPLKDVLFFALEAGKDEIYARMLYKELTRIYFLDPLKNESKFNYQNWITGKTKIFEKYEQQARNNLKNITNLKVVYGGEFYKLENFEADMGGITKDSTSLVIVDHLHYFDTDGGNENQELYKIVKNLRSMFLEKSIPIILISHVRKRDLKYPSLVPSSDDLHGTSNISKVATKIITLGAGFSSAAVGVTDRIQYLGKGLSTFIKVQKNRLGQDSLPFVALIKFSGLTNSYSDGYVLGKQKTENKEIGFEEITNFEIPFWAENEVWNKNHVVTKKR